MKNFLGFIIKETMSHGGNKNPYFENHNITWWTQELCSLNIYPPDVSINLPIIVHHISAPIWIKMVGNFWQDYYHILWLLFSFI